MFINNERTSSIIDEQTWENAKNKLKNKYQNSDCIDNCMNMIKDFEINYPQKYYSDLEEFIRESHYEDFFNDEKEKVYVSTIHKAKGREYDNVYIMLNQIRAKNDEEIRKLYVGMTRAKTNLSIHYNNDIFDNFNILNVENVKDNLEYSTPSQISMQLTHKDVVLSYFKNKKSA